MSSGRVVAVVFGLVHCCTAESIQNECMDKTCTGLSATASTMLQLRSNRDKAKEEPGSGDEKDPKKKDKKKNKNADKKRKTDKKDMDVDNMLETGASPAIGDREALLEANEDVWSGD